MNFNEIIVTTPEQLEQMISNCIRSVINEINDESEVITKTNNDTKKYYTVKDLASKWAVKTATIRQYVRLGKLNSFQIGRQILFKKEDIDMFELKSDATPKGRHQYSSKYKQKNL